MFLRPSPPQKPLAFTLIELLVVITIIAILAGIALPVYQNALAKSRQAQCGSNLKQIGIGLSAYAADNSGSYPAASTTIDGVSTQWTKSLGPYLPKRSDNVESEIFVCPTHNYQGLSKLPSRTYGCTGAMLGNNGATATISRESDTIYASNFVPLVVEGQQPSSGTTACTSNYKWSDAQSDLQVDKASKATKLAFRHRDRMNMLYADMSLRNVSFADAKKITQARWNGVQ